MHIPICAEAKSGLLMRFCLATLSICLLTEQEVKHSPNTPMDGIIKSHLIKQHKFLFIQFLYPSPLERLGRSRLTSFYRSHPAFRDFILRGCCIIMMTARDKITIRHLHPPPTGFFTLQKSCFYFREGKFKFIEIVTLI